MIVSKMQQLMVPQVFLEQENLIWRTLLLKIQLFQLGKQSPLFILGDVLHKTTLTD